MKTAICETTEWEVIDAEQKAVAPTPARIYLHTPSAIRREMASVYRDMRTGRIETHEGTRLIYVLDKLRDAYKDEVLAQRLESIEQAMRMRK